MFSGSDNSDVTDVQAFQPAMFHIFSTIDTEHPWNKLASDSTSTLTEFLKDEPNADKPLSSSDISNILIALGMDHKLFNTLLPEATVGDKYKNNPAYPLFDSNIKEANNLLQKNVLSSYNESTGVFGNKNTILLQRQGFIITALYYNLLPHSSH